MPLDVSLSVSLASSASLAMVRTMSRLVYEHCLNVGLDDDTAARFQMAALELTENVVKYSTGPEVKLEVALLRELGQRVLCVRASNETSDVRLREVARRFRELAAAPDPLVLYDRLIRESATQRDVSGLGLVRLMAEGNFDLDYAIEGRLLTISARARVSVGEGRMNVR